MKKTVVFENIDHDWVIWLKPKLGLIWVASLVVISRTIWCCSNLSYSGKVRAHYLSEFNASMKRASERSSQKELWGS